MKKIVFILSIFCWINFNDFQSLNANPFTVTPTNSICTKDSSYSNCVSTVLFNLTSGPGKALVLQSWAMTRSHIRCYNCDDDPYRNGETWLWYPDPLNTCYLSGTSCTVFRCDHKRSRCHWESEPQDVCYECKDFPDRNGERWEWSDITKSCYAISEVGCTFTSTHCLRNRCRREGPDTVINAVIHSTPFAQSSVTRRGSSDIFDIALLDNSGQFFYYELTVSGEPTYSLPKRALFPPLPPQLFGYKYSVFAEGSSSGTYNLTTTPNGCSIIFNTSTGAMTFNAAAKLCALQFDGKNPKSGVAPNQLSGGIVSNSKNPKAALGTLPVISGGLAAPLKDVKQELIVKP